MDQSKTIEVEIITVDKTAVGGGKIDYIVRGRDKDGSLICSEIIDTTATEGGVTYGVHASCVNCK